MKILLFGATGMIGQGVLRECLLDAEVTEVIAVVRSPTGQTSPKLVELVHDDMARLEPILDRIATADACLYCLGVSSAGMSEADYRAITFDMTMAAARPLAKKNPSMTFVYVSGASTDSSEKGSSMWARVKGETENALSRLPFRAKYMARPAFIQPMHGIRSKTRLYRAVYAVLGPLYPVLKALAPRHVTTTEQLGKAMLVLAKRGAEKEILENEDLNRLATG